MKQEMQNALLFTHRANIDRYRRLLKTHLADHEREFIERRLGEEEDALLEIVQHAAQFDCRESAQN